MSEVQSKILYSQGHKMISLIHGFMRQEAEAGEVLVS